MIQPHQHIFGAIAFGPARNGGAINHQDRQAQIPRGDQLGIGAIAARVLAHHEIDGVGLHQGAVASSGERPAIDDQGVMGQAGRLVWRIDKAQQIMILRLGRKGCHMHPAQRQHYAAGRACQRCHRTVDAGNAGPAVPGGWLPRPAGQRHMRHSSQTGCFHGMAAHRRGKGVGRVHQMSHAVVAQIIGQPRHAAEPADAHRHRLRAGIFGPSGIAERRHNAMCRQQPGERAGLGGATQQEDVLHG